jgi:hypothetical protein
VPLWRWRRLPLMFIGVTTIVPEILSCTWRMDSNSPHMVLMTKSRLYLADGESSLVQVDIGTLNFFIQRR